MSFVTVKDLKESIVKAKAILEVVINTMENAPIVQVVSTPEPPKPKKAGKKRGRKPGQKNKTAEAPPDTPAV